MKTKNDALLMVLLLLFLVVLILYAFGFTSYPYGMILLSAFIVARVLHLRQGR